MPNFVKSYFKPYLISSDLFDLVDFFDREFSSSELLKLEKKSNNINFEKIDQ